MKAHSIWAMAAASLYQQKGWNFYQTLTSEIVATSLTKLSGVNAGLQLCSILAQQKLDGQNVFGRVAKGIYNLRDRESVAKHPQVVAALQDLQEWKEVNRHRTEDETRVQKLEQENARLRKASRRRGRP